MGFQRAAKLAIASGNLLIPRHHVHAQQHLGQGIFQADGLPFAVQAVFQLSQGHARHHDLSHGQLGQARQQFGIAPLHDVADHIGIKHVALAHPWPPSKGSRRA